MADPEPRLAPTRLQLVGLPLGPALFVGTHLFVSPAGLSAAGTAVLASTLWMATWWTTEAIPIPVTSLLPVLLFPIQGVTDVTATTAPYADPVVFLFLGGFLVALAIERWGLHRRIALTVLVVFGGDGRRLVLGFMLVTALLSMWISNTATAMLMVPIGMAVVAQVRALGDEGPDEAAFQAPPSAGTDPTAAPPSDLGTALLLGIAYGASIGGVATVIGTPPNAILAGIARRSLGVDLGFAEWMAFGVPLAAVFLLVAWGVLVTLLDPGGVDIAGSRAVVARERAALGPMGTGERRVVLVFGLVVAGWLSRPFVLEPLLPAVTDTTVAVVGGVLVFLVPVDLRRGEFLLDWSAASRVPWGVLLLFGAGFSLANAFVASGLDAWLADGLAGLRGLDTVWVVLAVATVVVFLTEVTSNSATASLFLPVMVSLGASLAVSPLVLMVTVAVGASLAFMLPVATPPNAIVFGSGSVSIPQMARVGLWLNLVGVLLVTLATAFWLPVVWGL